MIAALKPSQAMAEAEAAAEDEVTAIPTATLVVVVNKVEEAVAMASARPAKCYVCHFRYLLCCG